MRPSPSRAVGVEVRQAARQRACLVAAAVRRRGGIARACACAGLSHSCASGRGGGTGGPREERGQHAPLVAAVSRGGLDGEVTRVRSHCHFRNRGADSLSESGIKWMSGGTKRQCDRALMRYSSVPSTSRGTVPAAATLT
jgi:hypothetical protein